MSEKLPWQACEAELIAEFLRRLERADQSRVHRLGSGPEAPHWTVYPETAGWDVLLVHRDGFQLGIEAKLALNPKVIEQALVGQHRRGAWDGPDYRGVLVPAIGRQHHLGGICDAIGLGIITLQEEEGSRSYFNLPDATEWCRWHNWGPAQRCKLPDYVPDVRAGLASPVQLTDWKIRAIKLMIVLERKGWVDRADMRCIGISPSRWTDRYNGFLAISGNGQYVRSPRTPDLRAQHPENYVQIEADVAEWGKSLSPFKDVAPDWLLAA